MEDYTEYMAMNSRPSAAFSFSRTCLPMDIHSSTQLSIPSRGNACADLHIETLSLMSASIQDWTRRSPC